MYGIFWQIASMVLTAELDVSDKRKKEKVQLGKRIKGRS